MTRNSIIMDRLKLEYKDGSFICINSNYTVERTPYVIILRSNEISNPIISLSWIISGSEFIGIASYMRNIVNLFLERKKNERFYYN